MFMCVKMSFLGVFTNF